MKFCGRGLCALISALPIAWLGLAGQTITVPDDYPTIQAAIDAAEPGATIVLMPGEYNENLVLTKDLTLQGNSAKVNAGNPERPVVVVLAGVVCLEGLVIRGGQYGILVGPTTDPGLHLPFIPSPLKGFRRPRTWSAPHVTIIDCTIQDNSCYGVSIFDNSLIKIINCRITGNGWGGVELGATSRGIIRESNIRAHGMAAITVYKPSRVEITNCVISGFPGVSNSGHAVISSCLFESQSHYSGSGVKIWEGSHTTIRNSTIRGCYAGIDGAFASGDVELEVVGNTLYDNKYGIEFDAHSSGVRGANNVMYANGIDIVGNLPPGLRAPLVIPREHEVRLPDAHYPTLQHAVDALLPGGRLTLEAGEYKGGITIDKDITVEAVPGARVSIVGGEVGISVVGEARVSLKGFIVTNAGTGVQVGAQSEVELTNCAIRNSESPWAMLVGGNGVLRMVDGDIQGNDCYGLFVYEDGKAVLKQCSIQGNSIGVHGAERAELELTECRVVENESGVTVEDTAKAVITKTVFENSTEKALFVLNSAGAQLYNVKFEKNGVGIYIGGFATLECHDVVLHSNTIGISTWTQTCGVNYAYKLFLGWVKGRVCSFGNLEADLCPAYPGYPWPEGFLKEGATCE